MSISESESLYEIREKIYPRQVHGLFATLRIVCVIALMGFFYICPWLTINEQQIILFDLPGRKFYIFGIIFWPQDLLYLTFLLMVAAYSLFFFTAIAGRLWCGYACPQTVWTEVFLSIERWIEGDRSQQIKLDKSPISIKKFRIKCTKHALWIIFSLYTGFTFVAYFTPPKDLITLLSEGTLSGWEQFWILFYSFATYGNAGWMREQVCKYMCPYARFQSAMFDKNTFIISYDDKRGEPRGSRRKGTDHRLQGKGDCVDCTLCVQVCPTGIDIRNGLQYECIGCSACIDVCNHVMEKMDYEPGLIRYTTQNAMEGIPTHLFRPRIIIYSIILVLIISLLGWSLLARKPIGLDVIRDRNQLFRETIGLIENVYTLKIINMDNQDHDYTLEISGITGLQYEMDQPDLFTEAGKVVDIPIRLRAKEKNLKNRSTEVMFSLTAKDDPSIHIMQDAKFLGP